MVLRAHAARHSNRRPIPRRQVVRQRIRRKEPKSGVFVTDRWFECTLQRAIVRRDEYMPARQDLEQVRVDRRADCHPQVQRFRNLPGKTFCGRFTQLKSPAGQFLLATFVEQRHDFTGRRAQRTFDGDGIGGHGAYLPIQNRLKMTPRRSSAVNSPVISPSACWARRSSSAKSSRAGSMPSTTLRAAATCS